MKKQYVKPTLEFSEFRLHDVIMYSPPQQETYEVPIKKQMQQELVGTGDLTPEETLPPESP